MPKHPEIAVRNAYGNLDGADLRAPDPIQNPPIGRKSHRGHVALHHPRFTVREKRIERLGTGSRRTFTRNPLEMTKVRELLCEREGASGNTLLNSVELLTCPAEVGLRGRSAQGGAVSHAFELEIETDSVSARSGRAARFGFPAHLKCTPVKWLGQFYRLSATECAHRLEVVQGRHAWSREAPGQSLARCVPLRKDRRAETRRAPAVSPSGAACP